MKTRYIVGLFLVGASVLSSCSDFTEIDQKGMNLLSTTDQLEMLLNQEYNIRIADIQRVCGSVQYYPGNVGTVLANPVKTTTQILLKYDEAGTGRPDFERQLLCKLLQLYRNSCQSYSESCGCRDRFRRKENGTKSRSSDDPRLFPLARCREVYQSL